jgi:Ca-activated chloride channel family protein
MATFPPRPRLAALLLAVAPTIAGCGAGDGGFDGGGGLTPGGVKDLTLARELIAAGQVPPADAILPEAMFAEHDLPLAGAPCEEAVCLRAAAGLGPDADGATKVWVQLGMSTAVDLDTWQRPATSFIYTVDVSGSMRWGGGEASPGELARLLLHELASQLRPDDRVAIVTYGSSVETALPPVAGASAAQVHAVIDDLAEDGSTNMEAGLERAIEVGEGLVPDGRPTRIVLFTDEQPNVGATDEGTFGGLVSRAAAGGIDTSVMAFGPSIGAELLRGMASWRGANAFSFLAPEDVADFAVEHAPFFATVIAENLRLNLGPEAPWIIDRGIGLPAADDGQLALQVNSLFLSRRRGALLVALDPRGAALTDLDLDLRLAYVDDGVTHEETLPITLADVPSPTPARWHAQPGVAATAALALLTEAMHEAALAYSIEGTDAAATLDAALAAFDLDVAAITDETVRADVAGERELASALRGLIARGAPQAAR